MGVYDTIVLLIVLAGAFFGWRKGLATQVASIVSVAASFFVAINFQAYVTPHIDANPPLNGIAAFVILFVGTWIVAWMAFGFVRSWIESLKLKEFDYQMGALLGGFKGFLVASVLMILALSILQEDQHSAIIHSRSGTIISRFLAVAEPRLPEQFRMMAGPFLEPLRNNSLPEPGYFPPGDSPPPGYAHPGYGQPPNPAEPSYPVQPQYRPPSQNSADPGYVPNNWRANSGTSPRY